MSGYARAVRRQEKEKSESLEKKTTTTNNKIDKHTHARTDGEIQIQKQRSTKEIDLHVLTLSKSARHIKSANAPKTNLSTRT